MTNDLCAKIKPRNSFNVDWNLLLGPFALDMSVDNFDIGKGIPGRIHPSRTAPAPVAGTDARLPDLAALASSSH